MLQNNFKVITETKKENSKSLEEIIEERRLLKIKLMLLQISDLDSDLKMLEKHQVTIPNLTLQDIFLTDYHVIYAPIKNKITRILGQDNLKRNSYLIYLSYLYGINLFHLLENNPILFYQIIDSFNIHPDIKRNLFKLLNGENTSYFEEYLPTFENASAREQLLKIRKQIREKILV